MDKINEQMYKSNIYLVDKNRWLEEDKKILLKRMKLAIEMLEEYKADSNNNDEICNTIIKVLKGRYIKNV